MSASHDSQCSGLSELLCGFRVWRQLFLKACRTQPQLQTQDIVDGKLFERLVQIRKSGKLEVKATKRARAGDKVDVENWLPVAEIASRRMHLQIGSVKFEPIPQRKRPRGCMSFRSIRASTFFATKRAFCTLANLTTSELDSQSISINPTGNRWPNT